MNILFSILCAFALDLLLGDPNLPLPHTVVVMGKIITCSERWLRRLFPATKRGELISGALLGIFLPLSTLAFSAGCIALANRLHPTLGFLLHTYWCWRALALKDLSVESRAVYEKLVINDLPAARIAVSRIVGRDTQQLSSEGVAKAAVETVAENFSDGVIAPLLYMVLGGAPLALCYKAVNTMDSMIGYRNERYLYFGRFAARLDDYANYLPSRLSALLLICVARICGTNTRDAWLIWRRDRRNHPSPNSAQCEAAMAGALGIQLAGDASYFGKTCHKPTIGDRKRSVIPEDILQANKLIYAGGLLGLALLCSLRGLISCIL